MNGENKTCVPYFDWETSGEVITKELITWEVNTAGNPVVCEGVNDTEVVQN
jgi:hypothetical protein